MLSLNQMEPLAREATHNALKGFKQPSDIENLTLGSQITDTEGVFELYVAGERNIDAQVISRAKVNRSSGQVEVEVFLNPTS